MPRSTMTALIARVKAMCNGDTTISDDDYQTLLDDHAVAVDSILTPRIPFYTKHLAPFENLETDAVIYYGFKTLLVENTDYTADYQRGIFTTPAADYRGLRILGTAYDINAAAADGWERIAARSANLFEWSDVEGHYRPGQAREAAIEMAAQYRRRAWAMGRTVERDDTPPLRGDQSWRDDLLARERAGYGPS